MMTSLTVAAVEQATPTPSGNPWVPIFIFLVCASGVVLLYRTYKEQLGDRLAGDRNRRTWLTVFLVGSPFILGGIADWADFTEIVKGDFGWDDTIPLSGGAVFLWAWLLAHAVNKWHSDLWDQRVDEERKEQQRQRLLREGAENDRDFVLEVSNAFLKVVGVKGDRIRKELGVRAGKSGNVCPHDGDCMIKEALQPTHQITELLLALFSIYRTRLEPQNTLRLAFFRLTGEFLKLEYAWDGVTTDCIQSPLSKHRAMFNIKEVGGVCLAVAAARDGQLWIIPDAEEADRDRGQPFSYFDQDQRSKIKSIMALPLRLADEPTPAQHVVTVDTNRRGFFDYNREDELKLMARNLAHRLHLEEGVGELLGDEKRP